MAFRTQFLIFLTIMALFSFVRGSMRNNFIDFVPSISQNRVEESTGGDDDRDDNHLRAYPLYSNMFDDGKIKGFIKKNTDDFTSTLEILSTKSGSKAVNVKSFGAIGDGKHDDSQAFVKAWNAACSSNTGGLVVVPKGGTFLLKPTTFSGPCKSSITFEISGTILASGDRSDFKDRHWLLFDKVSGLLVEGGGTVNGNGKIWWQNSCKTNKKMPCKDAPTALTFLDNKNLVVKNINVRDAQQIQLSFQDCVNVQASYITVTAPEDSPNTDGIHVTNTQNIHISNCVIGTGDDCISIVSGSKNVQATDITCGPGHGISIGSLGKKGSVDYVSGVIVNGAKLTGTTNGVRIKTWQGGSGSATNITFQNIQMENVNNPIIIDQDYCDQKGPCKAQQKAVQVKNVLYKNIKGTSASDVAIKFDCSKTYPCQGVMLQNVDLVLKGDDSAKATCSNVKLLDIGEVTPQC